MSRRPSRRRARASGARAPVGTSGGTERPRDSNGGSSLAFFALFVAFLGAGFLIYEPALDGAFISDDMHYVRDNPYVHDPSGKNLLEILNPFSVVAIVVENYAPVHLLLHAGEWQAFGTQVRGYHVVNVIVHALACLLLAVLFTRTGVPFPFAALGAALFLVHPANVEAVAWISQLKTSAALLLSLGALLLYTRRPALGTLCFGLALLAKPTAAVVLFFAATLLWAHGASRAKESEESRESSAPGWRWLGVWGVLLVAFAVFELLAFSQTAGRAPPLYEELAVRLRTICAIGLRYLVMAASATGLSAFHETPPSARFDPWWLGSLLVLGLLAARVVVTFRRRSSEAAYWVWAGVSFAPICGLIPLPFPMADRYLYFILPWLIGALLLAAPEFPAVIAGSAERWGLSAARLQVRLRPVALVTLVVLVIAFGFRANARARYWQSAHLLMADAELNYPEGAAAKTRQARRAALAGDIDGVVEALRAAQQRGYNRLDHLLNDPAYARIQGDPSFRALLDDMAREWLERIQRNPRPSQIELRVIAQAQIVLGDLDAAVEAIERALAVDGPIEDDLRQALVNLRLARKRQSN